MRSLCCKKRDRWSLYSFSPDSISVHLNFPALWCASSRVIVPVQCTVHHFWHGQRLRERSQDIWKADDIWRFPKSFAVPPNHRFSWDFPWWKIHFGKFPWKPLYYDHYDLSWWSITLWLWYIMIFAPWGAPLQFDVPGAIPWRCRVTKAEINAMDSA